MCDETFYCVVQKYSHRSASAFSTTFYRKQFDGLTPDNQPELLAALQQAEGLIGSGGKIDQDFLQLAPNLRAASTISVGYDNFDVEALSQRGIALMHTPTVLTETVADTMMALMLSTARRVVELAERVKAGEWQESIGDDWFGVDVHHKPLVFWAWAVLAWR